MKALNVFETSEFKKLEREWTKKLKASGFVDIENRDNGNIIHSELIILNDSCAGHDDYYQYCHDILRDFPFRRELDRVIFERHAEGCSLREIEEWLENQALGMTLSHQAINNVIDKIKSEYKRA